MRTTVVICGVLLCAATPSALAHAAAMGINFNWSQCYGDGPVTSNLAFACNTNTGSNTMVCSYVLSHDIAAVSGNEIVVDLAAPAVTLPPWWYVDDRGFCRFAVASGSIPTLDGNAVYGGVGGCADYWAGAAQGGVAAYKVGLFGPNTARLILAFTVPQASMGSVSGGIEYFSCNLVLYNAKSVGLGACGGCQTPVCLVLNSIKITTPTPLAGTDVMLTTPATTGSNFLTWQGGGEPVTELASGCPGAVPTRNATWGAVKALFR